MVNYCMLCAWSQSTPMPRKVEFYTTDIILVASHLTSYENGSGYQSISIDTTSNTEFKILIFGS
jgi:hypothetical protein